MRPRPALVAALVLLAITVPRAEERTQPLLLFLRGRDAAGLTRFLGAPHEVWLTPHEFGRRFGARPRALRAASRWLRARGLRVRRRLAGRTVIEFDGPPAVVEAALGVRLARAHGRFRSARPATVPAGLDALAVQGLGETRPVPRFVVRPLGRRTNIPFFISPGDFRHIYGLDAPGVAGLDGRGQRISIPVIGDVDHEGVDSFVKLFNLPLPAIRSTIAGRDPGPGRTSFQTEATLDVTWAHAVATAADIDIVRGSDLFAILAQQVNQDPAPVVSISLGLCSASRTALRQAARVVGALFAQAAAQGQTVLVASGDTGAFNCNRREADLLASSPHVTAVGGTVVAPVLDAAGDATAYGTERVWNTGDAASGGGRSAFFRRPRYQRGRGGRTVPDVALPADDYPIGSGTRVLCCIGGTSASAPAWAGVVALLGQARGARLGLLNPTLYRWGRQQHAGGARVFHDVTQGNSSLHDSGRRLPGFRAHRGYDLATGWGSPDVPVLLDALSR